MRWPSSSPLWYVLWLWLSLKGLYFLVRTWVRGTHWNRLNTYLMRQFPLLLVPPPHIMRLSFSSSSSESTLVGRISPPTLVSLLVACSRCPAIARHGRPNYNMFAAPHFYVFFRYVFIIRSTNECLSYSTRSLWSNQTHNARSLAWISKFSRHMAYKVFYVLNTAKYTHLFWYAKPRSIPVSVLSPILMLIAFFGK